MVAAPQCRRNCCRRTERNPPATQSRRISSNISLFVVDDHSLWSYSHSWLTPGHLRAAPDALQPGAASGSIVEKRHKRGALLHGGTGLLTLLTHAEINRCVSNRAWPSVGVYRR